MSQTLVKVLPKGQITIPRSIRRQFDIVPNEYLTLETADGAFVLKPLVQKREKKSSTFTAADFADRDCSFAADKGREREDVEFVTANQKSQS